MQKETTDVRHREMPSAFAGTKQDREFVILSQRSARMALYDGLRAAMLDCVAKLGRVCELWQSLETCPTFILQRASPTDDWSLVTVEDICNSAGVKPLPAWTLEHFQGIAACLRMLYGGVCIQTLGTEKAELYHMDATVLPFYPDVCPVRCRKCYWKWSAQGNTVDVVIASFQNLLVLLMEVAGMESPLDPLGYPAFFRRLAAENVTSFMSRVHVLEADPKTECLVAADDARHARLLQVFQRNACEEFADAARPLQLNDYKALARMAGCLYLGHGADVAAAQPDGIPSTFFTETAVFSKGIGKEDAVCTSYFRFSLNLQRRLPTADAMQYHLEEFHRTSPPRVSMTEYIKNCFPGASEAFVTGIVAAVYQYGRFEEWHLGLSLIHI